MNDVSEAIRYSYLFVSPFQPFFYPTQQQLFGVHTTALFGRESENSANPLPTATPLVIVTPLTVTHTLY